MEGLRTVVVLQDSSSIKAGPMMLCWTSASLLVVAPGGWLACHPAQGDSTFTQVQPSHQEPEVSLLLIRDGAPLVPAALPVWTSCFEFLLLTQLRETATDLRKPQATQIHPATEPALLLPCWDLGTVKGSHMLLPPGSFSPSGKFTRESLRRRL